MQIQRKSYSGINRTYFSTATIHQWLPLLLVVSGILPGITWGIIIHQPDFMKQE
jgi:hypothetical protein